MKHFKNSFVLLLTLFMLMGSSVCKADFYAVRIASASDLAGFRDRVNNGETILTQYYNESSKTWGTNYKFVNAQTATVILEADINLYSYSNWVPIGISSSSGYQGTFDGNGHTISDMYVTKGSYAGLFGYVDGSISNLTVSGNILPENSDVGMIAGYFKGTMTNCSASGNITSFYNNTGGLIGRTGTATITNCTNSVNLDASADNVGGIVGRIGSTTTLEKITNKGIVKGKNYVGGIAGWSNNTTFRNCELNFPKSSTTPIVQGTTNVGGIVGYVEGTTNLILCNIEPSSSIKGDVENGKYIGGLIGYSSGSTIIESCYSKGYISAIFGTSASYIGQFVGYDNGYTDYLNSFWCNYGLYENEHFPLIGKCASANGTISNCYYLNPVTNTIKEGSVKSGEFTAASYLEFENGSVTYHMNHTASKQIYAQKVGAINTRSTPCFYTSSYTYAVYLYTHSASSTTAFSNIKSNDTEHDKYIVAATGKCSVCEAECRPPLVSGWYEISTVKHLNQFAKMVNNGMSGINGRLKNNISYGSATPIGNSYSTPFSGEFDGAGYTISNLEITANSLYIGLFGYSKGVIRNLTVSGNVTNDFNSSDNSSYTGMIVGRLEGTIENCYTSGSVTVPNGSAVGGLAGSAAYNFEIKSCGNNATVKGIHAIGGIVGRANLDKDHLLFEKCYNTGTIIGTGNNIGGLIGYHFTDNTQRNLTIENCFNTGTIKGASTSVNVGGLVGRLIPKATFTSCFSAATVSGGSARTGAVVGFIDQNLTTTATNCYYNSEKESKAVGSGTLSTGEFTGATTAEFESGAITYALNNGNTEDPVFRQYISSSSSLYFIGKPEDKAHIVYAYYAHGSDDAKYSNTKYTTKHTTQNSEHNHDEDIDAPTGICSICNSICRPPYISGYYEISTPEHLVLFANMVNKGSTTIKGILKNNIYLKDNFTPIGNSTNPFNGTFDGAGHTISNLKITANSQYVGLFGYSKGVIRNLTVRGNVTNDFNSTDKGSYTGMIVGSLEGTIENCYTSGSVTVSNSTRVGGLVGYAANNFEIKSCGNNATVKGIAAIGGIVGRADLDKDNSLLEKCYNTGAITGTGNNIGGLIGYLYSSNTQRNVSFENCYNTGAIKGESTSVDVGGLVGWIRTNATFTSCYSSANVEGKSTSTGAVVGFIDQNLTTTATNCYYNSDKNSKAIGSGTLSTGEFTGATTAEFESGAITYALNNGNTEDPVFRQKLGVNPTSITIGTGNIIYAYYDHGSDVASYNNNKITTKHTTPDCKDDHDMYINGTGKCSICSKQIIVDDYYEIENYGRLLKFATFVNKGNTSIKARLTNNIVANKQLLNASGDATGVPTEIWTPINNFSGEFDGQGYTISGLYIDVNDTHGNAGLFDYVNGATIKNVHIVDSYFRGATVGAICVTADGNTKIEKCSNQSTVKGNSVAAICHNAMDVSISYCYNTGANVPLVGMSMKDTDCYIYGSYNAKYGKENTNVVLTNCYYLADEYTTDGGCTESQFNNGVVCWLLNGKQGISNLTWRQNPGDKYPSFTGSVVTKASMHCDHVYGSDFKCLICGDRKQLEVEDGFCLIHNSDELTLFALKVNEDKETTIKARLTNDIVANKQLLNASGDVTGVPAEIWTPIKGFGGEFDGQGYTISGLYANDTNENLGLFDNLNGATIKNVHIVDSYFNGASAGAICASADGRTKIYRCSNQSTVKGTGIIGAICGIPMNVSISYCYNTGANQPLVGISLDKEACTIENSYNAKPYKEIGNLTYTNSYYLADEYTSDGGCTESQFANGEVCWLLNGKKETSDVIWRQNPGDKYPSFEGAVVKGSEKKYNELHLSDEECDFANGKSYETVTYTRKVNSDAHSAHWGTVCLPFSFNESNCAGGVKFYEVTNVTENGIELNQITHVEAGQAVLFYNAGDWSVSVGGPVVIRNTVNEGDPMIGTYQQKAVEVGSNNYFYVKENKFYKGNTSFNVPAFHAYLEGTGVNSLSSFSIVRDNVMEEAEEEETAEAKTISAIYTANGQRVSEMNGKGVYIVVFSDGTSKKVHIVE